MSTTASTRQSDTNHVRPASITPELRAYLAHRMMRVGRWTYDLPDGGQIDSEKPAMSVPLREVFSRVQVAMRPLDGGHIVTATWQGMYPFEGARHSISGTYREVLTADFDLTVALAKEALDACRT